MATSVKMIESEWFIYSLHWYLLYIHTKTYTCTWKTLHNYQLVTTVKCLYFVGYIFRESMAKTYFVKSIFAMWWMGLSGTVATPPINLCWPRPSTRGTIAGKDWPMMEATEGRLFVDSVVSGFHVYKNQWTPVVGKTLMCEQEFGNIHDLYAVSVVHTHCNKTMSGTFLGKIVFVLLSEEEWHSFMPSNRKKTLLHWVTPGH